MSDGFETLIYTDCRPGQGLQGSAGLQFQARSAGAEQDAMAVVKRSLLYEAPSAWMRERRPVSDYPPSFGHTWDGCLATAAGVYLGREANGNREGNQLTHSVVTRDPDAYDSILPAQLYQAPFWVAEPAPTTTCPPLAPDWQPGPFAMEDAKEFVNTQPNGPDLLVSLLSALQRLGEPRIDEPPGSRVLFIAEDPDVVLRWIVAGTLLLPYRRALAVGFKVFSTDPARATQQVVAVHPAWDSTPARVGNDLGYAVFDLSRGEWSKVPPTPDAPGWVNDFCTGDDPRAVMDAIEVAAESGLPVEPAAVLGRAAELSHKLTLADAAIVAAWLRETPPSLLMNYRGNMMDRLIDSVDQWPQRVLVDLDELARSGQVPEGRAASVRLALIRAELDRAARTAEALDVALPALPAGAWTSEHQDAAEHQVVESLWTASGGEFDAVLRVAQRFTLEVRLGELTEAVDRFVVDWADRPDRRYEPRVWPCGTELEDRLVNVLNERVEAYSRAGSRAATTGRAGPRPAGGVDQVNELARRWWPMLRHRIDGGHFQGPMHEALVGVTLLQLPGPEADRFVHHVLDGIRAWPPGDPATVRVVSALWRATDPSLADLRLVASKVRRGTPLEPELFAGLTERLGSKRLSAEDMEVAHSLVQSQLFRPSSGLKGLLDDDADLRDACARLGSDEPDELIEGLVAHLRRISPRLRALRADEIALVMLRIERPWALKRLVDHFPDLAGRYLTKLEADVKERRRVPRVAISYFLVRWGRCSDKLQKVLHGAVQRWIKKAPDERLRDVTAALDEVSEKLGQAWREDVAEIRGRSVLKTLKKLLPRGRG